MRKKNKTLIIRQETDLPEQKDETKPESAETETADPAGGVSAEKENRFFQMKHLKSFLIYFLIYFAAIVYWELLLRVVVSGSLQTSKWWFLIFAVPQALPFAALSGWWKDRLSRIVSAVLMLALSAFFIFQLIYFRISGSIFSLSMMGMGGDVMTNFGWAVLVTIRESVGWMLLFALPDLLLIAWIFLPKPKAPSYHGLFKPVALLLAVVLWFLGGQALRAGGTSDSSAYYAFTSAYADTDTSADKIGVFTTSLVEIKGMLLGTDAETEMANAMTNTADLSTLNLAFDSEPEPEQVDHEIHTQEDSGPDYSPHINEDIQFDRLADFTDDSTVRDLCNYFGGLSGTNKNDYTGLLEGYNVIMICGESFSGMAISEELTPTLYRMSNEGIVLTHYYNSFKNTTTNGEFAFMTGLWPDVSRKANMGVTVGSFGQSVHNYFPYALGNLFSTMDVNSYGYHNYEGSYYGRRDTHANLGYTMKFMGSGMEFSSTWPSSDLEMFEQSVDDYINEDRFNVYYMTFSGHGPYTRSDNVITRRHYEEVPSTVDGRELTYTARCYLANNLEVEESMNYLLQRLEEAGKLENTLIVLTGDHYPYYLDDASARSLLGETPDPDFEYYRSSCIMWCAGLDEPIVSDVPCCNVDILPTILNLLGVEYDSRLLPGTDIFSDSMHVAMLYNKNFITDRVKYNAATGEATWLMDTDGIDPKTLQEYTDSIYGVLKARYAASLSINDKDFYRYVWESLPDKDKPDDSMYATE
ncbi:MAG: LTA synthase family protein [Clostridia bacterium]|nr:LTA synthase family protein [Clostridia bacterium]